MALLDGDCPLLEAFRQGRASALTKVYEEYAPVVAAWLARGFTFESKGRTLRFAGYRRPYDLENALQETFLRAFARRARLAFDGLKPYRSYLFAIARNLVRSELRREATLRRLMRQVEVNAVHLEQSGQLGARSGEPLQQSGEVELMRQELVRLYQHFVAQLQPAQQLFFCARFEEALTQVEAGKRVGLSHMQARVLERKLRQSLLRFLHARGYLHQYRSSVKKPRGGHALQMSPLRIQ